MSHCDLGTPFSLKKEKYKELRVPRAGKFDAMIYFKRIDYFTFSFKIIIFSLILNIVNANTCTHDINQSDKLLMIYLYDRLNLCALKFSYSTLRKF